MAKTLRTEYQLARQPIRRTPSTNRVTRACLVQSHRGLSCRRFAHTIATKNRAWLKLRYPLVLYRKRNNSLEVLAKFRGEIGSPRRARETVLLLPLKSSPLGRRPACLRSALCSGCRFPSPAFGRRPALTVGDLSRRLLRGSLFRRLGSLGAGLRSCRVCISVKQIPQLLIVLEIIQSFDRLFVMKQHRVKMFQRKILVADRRAQHFLHAQRELLRHALEGDDWNVGVLDVGPDQLSPIRHVTIGFVGLKHALEPGEVRQQHDAIELVAKDRDLSGANNRARQRLQIGHAQILSQLLLESLGRRESRLRIATLRQQVALKSFKRRVKFT